MHRSRRRAFTLVEMLIAMIVSSIMALAVGATMFQLFRGFGESRDFGEATMRIDLIRSLSFDARTARVIQIPSTFHPTGLTATSRGDYTLSGVEGDEVRFVSLRFDSSTNTTTPYSVTWRSVRPAGSPAGTPYIVERWMVNVNSANEVIGSPVRDFVQHRVNVFEVVRTTNRSFSVEMRTTENSEAAAVQMVVSGRNVIN